MINVIVAQKIDARASIIIPGVRASKIIHGLSASTIIASARARKFMPSS